MVEKKMSRNRIEDEFTPRALIRHYLTLRIVEAPTLMRRLDQKSEVN